MKLRLALLLVLLIAGPTLASIDVYRFDSTAQQDRFQRLTKELRCPKCQNQSIADSDAGIAQDMRERVARMIREGSSDAEIVDYFVDRYGDFVSYRPPLNNQTMILWLGPGLLLMFGGLAIAVLMVRASRRADREEER